MPNYAKFGGKENVKQTFFAFENAVFNAFGSKIYTWEDLEKQRGRRRLTAIMQKSGEIVSIRKKSGERTLSQQLGNLAEGGHREGGVHR